MSHVSVAKTVKGKPLITDLEAVKAACVNLGLDCREDNDYTWWGNSVGDYAVPKGWKASDLGHNATLVISVPREHWPRLKARYGTGHGSKGGPYELAVVADTENLGCYTLMYDFIGGGYGLDEFIGSPVNPNRYTGAAEILAPTFMQHYRMCADALSAREVGDEIAFEEQEDGSWVSYTTVNEERMRVEA